METLYQQIFKKIPPALLLPGALFSTALSSAAKSEEGRRARNEVLCLDPGYGRYGHLLADFNPIAPQKKTEAPELS